jgi:uroporphyrinogen decarboxylase
LSGFLDAANHRPVDVTPVWLMRQAGRSLPEYRKLRERWTLADIVAQPELCAEVTLQPVRRLGVDAAVMFADIMLPLQGMGVEFDLVENVGPVIGRPITDAADIDRLRVPAGDDAAPNVIASIRQVVAQSPVPVIGFAGAPFTLASYLIEGKPSRDFAKVKTFMYSQPAAFDLLLAKLAATMAGYLQAQVKAGVSAVQLFDSWVGALAREDYRERVEPHTTAIFESLAPLEVPRIHFGTNTVGLLGPIAATGPDIISLDWRVPLDTGWKMVGFDRGIQGNLDPAVLLGPAELVRSRTRDVLRRAGGRAGHIFNLGHGVHPSTPLENLQLLVETVHEWQVARVA